MSRFTKFGGDTGTLQRLPGEAYLAEPAYRALEDMASAAANSDNDARATEIRESLRVIDSATFDAMILLDGNYGLPFALPAPVIRPSAAPGPSAAAPADDADRGSRANPIHPATKAH